MPDKKQILFNALSQDEVYKDKIGTEEEFYAKLNDPAKAKMLYSALSQDEVYADKVGSEEEFYDKIGLKKKGSTPSQSSAGSLQSQDDVFSQLQSNIQGKPQDFVVPAGFEAKKGKVIPKKQEEAIKFAGEQFQASSNIKRAKKDFESANFKQAKLQREIEDKKAVGDLQGIDDLIVRHDNEVQNIQNAQNIFATETERLNKVNDYFIKAAKINQLAELKKQKELAEEPAIIEVGKQFYNAILPPIVKGVGVATSAYGAFLDEFKGDPTEYNTLGDYIMDAGKNIIQGGESLKAEVSKKADKSIFKDEGYKDPRAYVNTMISGLGSIVQMGIGAELGVPMMVTGSLSAADGLYDGAKESGLSEKQSLGFAITLAPFVGALEEVGGNTYVKDFTKKAFQLAGKETAKKLVGKELTTDMVVKAFGETLKDKGVDYVKQVGKGVGLETLTGAGETAAQITGETIFDATIGEGKQKGEGAFGRDVTKPGFFSETAIEIAQGGIEEGIGALLPVAVAGRRNIGKERLYKDILKAKTDPTGINGWYNMIDVALQEGKINETQHAQAIQSIEEATNIVKRIPEKIDNPSAVMETVDLLTELDNKREEINKADDAFSGVLKNEAEEIEVKLKQILETNEPTQPIEYDIKDRTGVPGEERIGEEPIEAEPKQSTSPEEIKAGGILQAPTEEQIAKDVRDKNFVTFTYGSESEVPERFKNKISSSGDVNGKKQIKVTLPKSVADYEINRQKQIDTITDLLRNSDDNKFNEVTDKYFPNYKTVDEIAEEYYNDKENGSNPELVKAVEELLGKPTERPKSETIPNVEDWSKDVGSTAKALEGVELKPKEVSEFNDDWVSKRISKEDIFFGSKAKMNVLRATMDDIITSLNSKQQAEIVSIYDAEMQRLKGNPYAKDAAIERVFDKLNEYAPSLKKLFEKQTKGAEPFKEYLNDAIVKIKEFKQRSEAYHKAKADGSNPELVKAVEDLLGKKQEAQPAPEKSKSEIKEGDSVDFIDSSGKKSKGEKINIPNLKGLDIVMTKEGLGYKFYELASGMELVASDELDKDSAIKDVIEKTRKISSEQILKKLYGAEKHGSQKISIKNESPAYTKYKESIQKEEDEKPYLHTEEERKQLLDLADKAKAEGLEMAYNSISTSANIKSGAKLSIENATGIYNRDKKNKELKDLENQKKPYPKEDIELVDDSEESLKERVNNHYTKEKYSLIPKDIKDKAYKAYKKMMSLRNQYGYFLPEIKEGFGMDALSPEAGLVRYLIALNARDKSTINDRVNEALAGLDKGINVINEVYKKYNGKAQPKTGGQAKVNKKDSGSPKKEKAPGVRKPKGLKAPKESNLNKAYNAKLDDPAAQVMKYFIGGGKINNDFFQGLYGIKNEVEEGKLGAKALSEARMRMGLWSNKTGRDIDGLAHYMWENQLDKDQKYDTGVFRNAIEQVVNEHLSIHSMAKYILDKAGEKADRNLNEAHPLEVEAEEILNRLPKEYIDMMLDLGGQMDIQAWEEMIYKLDDQLQKEAELEAEYQAIQERFELEEEQRPEEKVKEEEIKVKPQEYEATKKAYEEAQEEYSAAKTAFEEKRKKLDKEILKDQENLFGERKSQEEAKLFDERVDQAQRGQAISKEKARLEAAEKNLKKAQEAWDKIKDKETGGIFGADEIAKRIRNKKQGGAMSAIDFGLSRMVYNGALEFMAKQVEKGTKLGNAIAKTIKWIDEQMEGKKWDKGAFAKYMNDEYKVKLGNGEVVDVVRDDTKETAEVINGFYLPIEQKILDTKQESMPANKWAEILKSKEDEDLYTGVREFLESRGTSTVTKQELKDFIKNNRIEIVEVVKGVEEPFQGWSDEEIEYHLINQMGFELEEVVGKSRHQMIMLASEEADFDYEPEGNTKYHQYQLPGEKENYKEVLITLPKKKIGEKLTLDKYNDRDLIIYLDGLDYTVSDYMVDESIEKLSRLSKNELLEKAKKIYDYDSKYGNEERALTYYNEAVKEISRLKYSDVLAQDKFKSSHFDEPNILVHLRMNTRKDAEGNKVLFLEEVQSDWGQEGKKKGFRDDEKIRQAENKVKKEIADNKKVQKELEEKAISSAINEYRGGKNPFEIFKTIDDVKKYAELLGLKNTIDILKEYNVIDIRIAVLKDKLEGKYGGVYGINDINQDKLTPTAPFVTDTNSWVRLGLKYALKQAVEQGADKLAWTTGEQQNERYDLSKQVDEIVYFPTIESGVYDVTVLKNDREILSKQMDLKEIESTLGKDIAEKIQKGEGVNRGGLLKDDDDVKSLMGLDLKVGGKGMKGFYGSAQEGSKGIIGGVAEKLFGQKVGTAEIQSENFDTKKIQYLADKYDVPVSMISKAVRTEDLEHQAEIGLTKSEVKVVEDFLKGSSTQPSIDITPEIKQYVKEGMPLFKGKEVPKAIQPQLSEEQIQEQGNKLEEIFNLEKTRDSKKSESVKEDFQKEIDKIAETLPKDLVEKAKFVKQNLGNIRTEMEKKNLLKVEC